MMVTRWVTEGAGRKTLDRDLEALALLASDDVSYQEVVKAIMEEKAVTDFPVSHSIRSLAGVWDELGLEETRQGPLVSVGGKLYVPECARQSILEKLHLTHPGKSMMATTAREWFWWPGLRQQVIALCEACEVCNMHAVMRMSGEMQLSEDISKLLPMGVVSLDLHSFAGKTYWSTQDRCSGYRWCSRLKGQSTEYVIKFLDDLMKKFGRIYLIRSDDGPCFRNPFKN